MVMGEIPVFVISLRDSEVRRRNVAAQLSALDVPFQFVDAIDGRSTPIPDIIDGASVVRSAFDTESQLACAASHRLLHRRIADGYSELALILEDDVRFADDFPAVLAAAAQFEFDVFKLEGGPYFRYHTAVHQIGCRAAIVGMLPSLGAAAYLITKTATQRFCALPNLAQPIDIAFADMRLWLRVLEVKPFVVVQQHRRFSGRTDMPREQNEIYAKEFLTPFRNDSAS